MRSFSKDSFYIHIILRIKSKLFISTYSHSGILFYNIFLVEKYKILIAFYKDICELPEDEQKCYAEITRKEKTCIVLFWH